MPFLNDIAPHALNSETNPVAPERLEPLPWVKNTVEAKEAYSRLKIGKVSTKVATSVDKVLMQDDDFLNAFQTADNLSAQERSKAAERNNVISEVAKLDQETLKDTLSTLENLNTKIW